jgi:lysophospholipase L1-like esterase
MPRVTPLLRTSALLGAGILIGEGLLAIAEPVPELEEFDASGSIGSGPKVRWLAVGDSTTTGPGLDGPDDLWIRQLARRHQDFFSIEIVSLAVGGSTTADVLTSQITQVRGHFDIAFVAAGSNDVLHSIPGPIVRRNLIRIVEALEPCTDTIVLMGVGDLGTIPRLRWPLNSVIRLRGASIDRITNDVAARTGALKVDHWQFRDHFDDPAVFAVDRFHPTSDGHRVWADAVDLVVAPLMHARV